MREGEHGVLEELTRVQGGWIWDWGQNGGRVGMGQPCRNCGPHHSSGLMLRAIGSYRGYVSRDKTGHNQIWAGREVAWKEGWGTGNPGKKEIEVLVRLRRDGG